jgi:hypothetical protein
MNYVEYLNLPSIPEELLDSSEQIINSKQVHNTMASQRVTVPHPMDRVKVIGLGLKKYLKDIFKQKMFAVYIMKHDNFIIHRDRSKHFINYIIDVGGENVKTVFF